MENQKQYCENLYQEYIRLKAIIDNAFQVQNYYPGRELDSKPAPLIEDMERFYEAKKELKEKCKLFLNLKPGEWFEIENK